MEHSLRKEGKLKLTWTFLTRCVLPVVLLAGLGNSAGCTLAGAGNIDTTDSIAYYTQLLGEAPGDPAVYYNRGVCHFRLQHYNEAIADFSNALRVDPGYSFAFLPRADCHRLLGNYQLAVSDYDSCFLKTGGSVYAYNARGYCWFRLKNYAAAAADYSKVILLKQGGADTYLRRGISYCKTGAYEQAAVDLQQAVKLAPDSGANYLWLGNAQFGLGNWDEAVSAYLLAKEKKAPAGEESHESEAYYQRANAEEQADPSLALQDLNGSIAADSANARAYFLRAKLFARMDDKESACYDFKKAAQLGIIEAFSEAKKNCDPAMW